MSKAKVEAPDPIGGDGPTKPPTKPPGTPLAPSAKKPKKK